MLFQGQFSPMAGTKQALSVTNSAVVTLAVPKNANGYAKMALIQAVDENVTWWDDGSAPTSSEGMVLVAGAAPEPFIGNLFTVQFIGASDTNSTLNVTYYN